MLAKISPEIWGLEAGVRVRLRVLNKHHLVRESHVHIFSYTVFSYMLRPHVTEGVLLCPHLSGAAW